MLLALITCLWLSTTSAANVVDVTTGLGVITGTTLQTRLGKSIYAFRGIRYAEAPVGELRFKNPQPIAAWKPSVFDATDDGPMCPQVTQNVTDASEDCLRLNVYSAELTSSKPVIVYIHPGGFYGFSAQSKNFAGPEHIMDRDIVLVTINYRLGTLGFLATGDEHAPGNAGLKDQVEALRWVQKHIHQFGGNPESVTLLGYSAGSFSIDLHLVSPMSKGLFHRGITMSASAFGQWQYDTKDLKLAKRQAKLLKCPTESNAEMVQCLRGKPMLDYINTMADMFDFNWNPILNWIPVIEPDCGQERFLIENPYKTILNGNFYKVPLISGITEYEFVSGAYYALRNSTVRQMFNENFEKYAPIAFLYEQNTPKSKEVSHTLRSKYLNNTNLEFPDSLEGFGELYSDALIGFEYHRALQLLSKYMPVYTYLFTYKGRYSFFMPENKTYAAVHHDELLYLLHISLITPVFQSTDPENDVLERLTRMWTEFATKGNPNNPNDPYLKNLNWPLYEESKDKSYLKIGNDLTLEKGGIYPERFKIWDELFPIPSLTDL